LQLPEKPAGFSVKYLLPGGANVINRALADYIVAELVRAHGGDIRLVPGTIGTTFSITVADRAVDLNARHGERALA
jgi:hypothetical protein